LAREGEDPVLFRRVEIWDAEKQEAIVFLSNLLAFGATTVAAIYKERWQVETHASYCTSFGRSDSSCSLWFLTGAFGPGSSNKHPPLSLYA